VPQVHTPDEQVEPGPQRVPQLPQWLTSVAGSVQAPLHTICPVPGHPVHTPETQFSPVAHACMQLPQCAGSLETFEQAFGQSTSLTGHWQALCTHEPPLGQAVPQVPQ
jgi:hypothetical protein